VEERKKIKKSKKIFLPLQMLHCYQYQEGLMRRLSSPVLAHVVSSSWSPGECPPRDLLEIL